VSEQALSAWVASQLSIGEGDVSLQLVSGDASPRNYYRINAPGGEGLVAVYSPESENNHGFLQVRELFEKNDVRVPELKAADEGQGFWIVEDLGDDLLFSGLSVDTVDDLYTKSLGLMAQIASIDTATCDLPHYDEDLLREELDRCVEWFFEGLLGLEMDAIANAYWDGLASVLIENAIAQPQVVVHRDFHCRNVMRLADGDVATIDFQDAVIGPLTYDPVSLLKDCYIGWTRNRQIEHLDTYRQVLMADGVIGTTTNETLTLWYDLMGLQRHLKVLGQFSRLHLRDGRSEYLNDLPMTLTYVRDIMTRYGGVIHEVGAFDVWVETTVMPAAQSQDWFQRMRLPKKVEKEPLLPK
jgi:hypothetical protein